jgi:thymidylate kinase
MLQLIKEFIEATDAEQIRYCHWKSNAAIERTLAGINDLDLLVAEEDSERFLSILQRLKFIRAISPVENWFPPISNYYGYDAASGRIVHLHLHYQLILGYDLIKNYHLPIEKEFLASSNATPPGNLKIPACEMELIVFVIRMVLKRRLLTLIFGSTRDLFKAISGQGRDGLGESARNELEYLRAKADPEIVDVYLHQYFPFLAPELFAECLASILSDAPGYAWLAAGRNLTRTLKPYRRHSLLATAFIVARRGLGTKLKGVLTRIGLRRRARKRLTPNGKIIAFLGGDGAGKTTNIASLRNWFGKHFEISIIHLGKPSKGPLWYLLGGLLKTRKLITSKTKDHFHQSLKLWLIARYRYHAFRRALRLRSKGSLVCLDRLPLPGMRSMDSPKIRALTGGEGLYSYLANREEAYYSRIRGVDELLVLRLDPTIAASRRPHDNQQELANRSGEVWNRHWPRGYAHLLDAAKPLDEVEKNIRDLVWASLYTLPKIIELIGPAGAGKSSAAKNILSTTCDLQTAVSWRDHQFICLKVMINRLPLILKSIGRRQRHLKILLGCEVTMKILQQHRQKQVLPCRNLVLEAGPISSLAYLETHNFVGADKWLAELHETMAMTIDSVVWLDASDDTLKARIDDRSKKHQLKNSDKSTAEEFFQIYRQSFSSLVGKNKVDLPLKFIDTERHSIDQVAEMINNLLQGKQDG